MTITTMPAPVEFTRGRLAGLLAAVTAATAAITWTVTTAAIDNTGEPARTTTATWQYGALGNPLGLPITTAADATAAADSTAIVVADAYHSVGIIVCPNGDQPVNVADAYHGKGTTVCP
jgi:hypothetical protein